MAITVVVLIVLYMGAGAFVARRYFLLRHRVGLEKGERGFMSAVLIGEFWPISIWFAAVRQPSQCNHSKHLLAHARAVDQAQELQRLRAERERNRR